MLSYGEDTMDDHEDLLETGEDSFNNFHRCFYRTLIQLMLVGEKHPPQVEKAIEKICSTASMEEEP
ncbi:MAG: hypothetical protein WBB36_11335 [Chitinophagales bacterium]